MNGHASACEKTSMTHVDEGEPRHGYALFFNRVCLTQSPNKYRVSDRFRDCLLGK